MDLVDSGCNLVSLYSLFILVSLEVESEKTEKYMYNYLNGERPVCRGLLDVDRLCFNERGGSRREAI